MFLAEVAALITVVVISPLLAGWSAALAGTDRVGWWLPRRVSWSRRLAVAFVAAAFTGLAIHDTPTLAWLMLAALGAVLTVVDVQTYRLPAPLVAALAVSEVLALTVTAVVQHDSDRLVRASLASIAVVAIWFALAFCSPSSLGLGDVWLAGITAGLLGWSSWTHVLVGQAAAWLPALPLAAVVALGRPSERGRKMRVPLGPAIIAGAILACWL